MDLKVYYRKIREIEASLPDGDIVIVSLETPDGGREGVPTEVPRRLAAKSMVEGKSRLASEAEAAQFRQSVREASLMATEQAATGMAQVETAAERRRRTRKADKPAA